MQCYISDRYVKALSDLNVGMQLHDFLTLVWARRQTLAQRQRFKGRLFFVCLHFFPPSGDRFMLG